MESINEILNFIITIFSYLLGWFILYAVSHTILETLFHWEQKGKDEAVRLALQRHEACYDCKPRSIDKIDYEKLDKTVRATIFQNK